MFELANLTPGGVVQMVVVALATLTVSTVMQRRGGWRFGRRSRPAPLHQSAPAAVTPPPLPVMQTVVQQAVRAPVPVEPSRLAIKAAAADVEPSSTVPNTGAGECIKVDANGRSIRSARHRRDVPHAKIMDGFLPWLIGEECSGWYTPELIYDAFQEYTWRHYLEEIDYRSFLSYLAATPGVKKQRAYVNVNETFRHLRAFTKGKERAVVYRIPTAQELTALNHRASVAAASATSRPLRPGSQKNRASTGRHDHGHEQPQMDLTGGSPRDCGHAVVADHGQRRAA